MSKLAESVDEITGYIFVLKSFQEELQKTMNESLSVFDIEQRLSCIWKKYSQNYSCLRLITHLRKRT